MHIFCFFGSQFMLGYLVPVWQGQKPGFWGFCCENKLENMFGKAASVRSKASNSGKSHSRGKGSVGKSRSRRTKRAMNSKMNNLNFPSCPSIAMLITRIPGIKRRTQPLLRSHFSRSPLALKRPLGRLCSTSVATDRSRLPEGFRIGGDLRSVKGDGFYNKTQVNNRDISIAVMRAFVDKRKEEHEARLSKKKKTAPADSEKESEPVVEEASNEPAINGNSNGDCEMPEDISQDEPCSIPEEPSKASEGKGRGELKPPRVLEALSASGLRALRYAREVEGIGQVVALDNDKVIKKDPRINWIVNPVHKHRELRGLTSAWKGAQILFRNE